MFPPLLLLTLMDPEVSFSYGTVSVHILFGVSGYESEKKAKCQFFFAIGTDTIGPGVLFENCCYE